MITITILHAQETSLLQVDSVNVSMVGANIDRTGKTAAATAANVRG